jgi:hypothetical protein
VWRTHCTCLTCLPPHADVGRRERAGGRRRDRGGAAVGDVRCAPPLPAQIALPAHVRGAGGDNPGARALGFTPKRVSDGMVDTVSSMFPDLPRCVRAGAAVAVAD